MSVFILATLPLVLAFLVFRRIERKEGASRSLAAVLAGLGALAGVVAVTAERFVLAWTDLSFETSRAGVSGALLAMFLLAAPLEEGLKVLVVVSAYRRRVRTPRHGLVYAVAAAAGFAVVEIVWPVSGVRSDANLARLALSVPAQLFFAGVWGYALGIPRGHDNWFRVAWLVAMLLHGLYDHIVFGRGPGLLVATIPMLLFMAVLTFMALRGEAPRLPRPLTSVAPPSLETVRERLAHRDRRLALRWVIVGAFVTQGLIVVTVATAVVAGNRFGMDFALADEADVRAAGPLVLLGVAVLAAFPVAGYLVARASSAGGLLEPALAAALTVGLLVAVFWLAAPIGVLLALAVAPIALALACGGAWIGQER
ncbi:MAG TPA: PrsW family glutamic-type intramembrane protease [Polyangiaceae bacterium]|nr:PrsW family glutamic-type intramembrane protease [Polyangiaceae bacterium]